MYRWLAATLALLYFCSPIGLQAQSKSVTQPSYIEQALSLGGINVTVSLPAGYEIELLTQQMSLPRIIHAFNQTLFVGSRSGAIYQLEPPYTNPTVLAQLKDYPHSVVVHDNYLYVAQTGSISRLRWILPDGVKNFPLTQIDFEHVVDLPGGRGHNSRTLKVGPDNRLYVSLGITGNCSDEYLDTSYSKNDQRGGIFVLQPGDNPNDRSYTLSPYASGLRNPVGFDWHEKTAVMYASNNGPDHLGYEFPRESFSAVTEGSFHGMPWFQWVGDELKRDPCIRSQAPRSGHDVVQPAATFPARIAPMDVAFVDSTATQWQAFQGDALVALHGSWATSDGSGGGDPATRRKPAIVRVEFDENGASTGKVIPFISGFQFEDGTRWARPMGLAFGADGALYFTSDGGVEGLYRVKSSGVTETQ